MTGIWIRIVTAWRLNPLSILRVLFYRFSMKTGVASVLRISDSFEGGPVFHLPNVSRPGLVSREGWYVWREAFGVRLERLSEVPPRWHQSLLNGCFLEATDKPWWKIPDFDVGIGDIKGIWEPSRFDWVLACAQRAAIGDSAALTRLNRWLEDWAACNPPYQGPNWKCGQEASIRVIHLCTALILLGQTHAPTPAFGRWIKVHLRRIAPTLRYAVGQDNNHGTSEAVALFVGGALLQSLGEPEGCRWVKLGRKWLENRTARLIMPDGSFSQYSVVYHRLMLDSLAFAERWRQEYRLEPFSDRFYRRAEAATRWLASMLEPTEGTAPNLGANDGARLLPLSDLSCRDMRPSVQLAAALFLQANPYPNLDPVDSGVAWLTEVPVRSLELTRESVHYPDGGYQILRRGRATVLFRYPRFRFRPSQSDLLHVDLQVGTLNLLRDGGSFSYNADPGTMRYFSGTPSHNTVEFDGHDQMPRLSRFLFGAWPRVRRLRGIEEHGEALVAAAGYADWKGNQHHRTLRLSAGRLQVVDELEGGFGRAVLRWRLPSGEWRMHDDGVEGEDVRIVVRASRPLARVELVEGEESLYYGVRSAIPVLEVEVTGPASLTTYIEYEE